MAWHALVFGVSVLAGFGLTLVALGLGRALRILDYPDQQRKLHARATPRTGGLALVGTLVVAVVLAPMLPLGPVADLGRFSYALVASTTLLCGLGLWDDKFGMRARAKFLGQILAVLPFVIWGRSTTTAAIFGLQIDLDWLALPLAMLWLVSCTNFVNLLDGLDGLASSVAMIIATSVAGLAWWNQQYEILLLATILGGALLGFLLHNWPPARVFLGDCGSLPLGFLVGALSLEASAKKAAGLTLTVPLVLFAVPIFDTAMAILRRKLQGRNIGQGDRQHIHHCLRDRGLSAVQALLALILMCTAMALAVVTGTLLQSDWIPLGCGLLLIVVLVARRIFGFHETQMLARYAHAAWHVLQELPRALRARWSIVRLEPALAAGQPAAWERAVRLARRARATRLVVTTESLARQPASLQLEWSGEQPAEGEPAEWVFELRIPRDDDHAVVIRAQGVCQDGIRPAAMAELVRMLRRFGELWPVAGRAAPAARIAPAATDPKPGRRAAARDTVRMPVAPHQRLESDAA